MFQIVMLHDAGNDDWHAFVMMKDDDGFDCVMLSRLLNECQNNGGRQLLSTDACNNTPMVMMMMMTMMMRMMTMLIRMMTMHVMPRQQ